jgi:hypothetical protein
MPAGWGKMRPILVLMVVALGSSTAARAARDGPEIGLRSGFSVPFGKVDGAATASISDAFSGFIPLSVDLGWRFTPDFYAGLTGSYAFGLPKDCPSNLSCSGHDVALGIDLRYHLRPDESFDPWLGIGAGYEWFTIGVSQGANSASATAQGFEFVHAQLGADVSVSPNVAWGPFIQLTLGQYRHESASSGGSTTSADVTNTALHEFLTFGVRVSFLP